MNVILRREHAGHEELFDLLVASGLFDDVTVALTPAMVGEAFDGSNLVITARTDHGRLVGVSRALTDFSRHCFIATMAVHPDAKRKGVGRRLVDATVRAAGDPTRIKVFLHSAPDAVGFYDALGFKREVDCFSLNNVN